MKKFEKAKSIVKTLNDNGYIAYFAGGWPRDHLLNRPCEDIDIATDAPPNVIQSVFKRTIPVGIAFGIVIVVIDDDKFEVASFRQDFEYIDGRHPSHVEFSSPKEDAKRRDFTINGMFYDPIKDEIIDYVNGKNDLKDKLIKSIGDPNKRIAEDKLRMLRAIRLSVCYNFQIEEKTKTAILNNAKNLFPSVAVERIWQELQKINSSNKTKEGLLLLHEYGLLQEIFSTLKNTDLPTIKKLLDKIDLFPKEAPLISKIMELFTNFSLEEKINLCKFLKLSNYETGFIEFLNESYLLFKKNHDNYTWAYFYANPFSQMVIDIYSCHLTENKKATFLEEHESRKKNLSNAIKRIINKNPVVTSSHLVQEKIKPGINMGILLKEAEKISINENIDDPIQIINKLKQLSIWPTERV